MTGVPRVRMPSLLALTLATVLVLGGCGDDEPGAAPARPDTPAGSAADDPRDPASPAPSPSSSPSPSEPSTAPARRPGAHKTGLLAPRPRAQASDEHLLAADRMPTLGGLAWALRSTTAEDPARAETVGACQKTALVTIGALSSVRRTFTGPDGIAATQVVARFADSRSAWRAHEVLGSWRADCEQRLDFPHAEVGPLEPVRVHAGTGESYRAAYGRKARTRWQYAGLGILRAGSYLTVVEITAGPGVYPDGWDPTRVAVRRISRTF